MAHQQFRQINLEELRELVRSSCQEIAYQASSIGRSIAIYLHWTAGHYGSFFEDYHVNIDGPGGLYTCHQNFARAVAWNPEKRIYQAPAHTWGKNTGALGFSMAAAYDAECRVAQPFSPDDIDFGPEPPTGEQIEAMAQAVAVACDVFGVPPTFDFVRTHAEQASMDGYGPGSGDPQTRWDLAYLPGYSESGGDVIRGKAQFYMEQLAAGGSQ